MSMLLDRFYKDVIYESNNNRPMSAHSCLHVGIIYGYNYRLMYANLFNDSGIHNDHPWLRYEPTETINQTRETMLSLFECYIEESPKDSEELR